MEQRTTREAAAELKISQTRVCQLLERVDEYVLEVAPGEESAESRGRRLFIAESMAATRLEWLSGQVTRAYKQSRGPQTIVRETSGEMGKKQSTTTRFCEGDGRLAMAAARLTQMTAKMPASRLIPETCDEMSEDDGEMFVDSDVDVVSEIQSPTQEDCSRSAGDLAVTANTPARETIVNALPQPSSAVETELAGMLKFLESRPVQPLGLAGKSTTIRRELLAILQDF